MEELSESLEQIINRAMNRESKWEQEVQDMKLKLQALLLGTSATLPKPAVAASASPQQKKKRAKRLSSIADDDDEVAGLREIPSFSGNHLSKTVESSMVVNETAVAEEVEVQQLPPEPTPEAEPEHVFARPMRAAKLKTENCLKEPSINTKLRRPDNPNETRKIKKENEQRPSQMAANKSNKSNKSQSEGVEPETPSANESVASTKRVDESVVVVADKDAPVVEISEEEDSSSTSSVVAKKKTKKEQREGKTLAVKVKKEVLSLSGVEETDKSPPLVTPAVIEAVPIPLKQETSSTIEETLHTTTTSTGNTTETTRGKRGRKKKEFAHRPIKEERISIEAVVPSPVSTRTRSGSITKPRADSVYEDAVDNIPQGSAEDKAYATPPGPPAAVPVGGNICNETVATSNATMVTAFDATYVANQANNTFAVPAAQTTFVMQNNATAEANDVTKKPNGSLGDATFDVRDPPLNDSIMTEDDSFEKPIAKLKQLPPPPPPATAKVPKSKAKPHELFNPCVQSPVKKKVEAFEHHAQAASNEMRLQTRSKRAKENSEPELPSIRDLKSGTVTTPVIGKPHAPVLGRFLTPTQQSNLALSSAVAKKLPNSASKIMPFPTSKKSSASNLKCTSSSSSQSLSRENSEEDLKKGFNKLQQLAEERKKKREIKHQQAALLRETKEKERAERLKKIMKEREEKNRKKIAEMEQKKRELEEINRNLKLQEERELKQAASSKTKLDAAEAARQERELLEQMKLPKMKMPPPPKLHNKYNFNMLHSDDSTDEEGKTSYKRPAPPLWSKSSVRTECIARQAYLSSDYIDSFFSVQPMTPDLKAIFPNIDPRHLKRNSSAIWQTPPRYSEMPKY